LEDRFVLSLETFLALSLGLYTRMPLRQRYELPGKDSSALFGLVLLLTVFY